MSRRVEIFLGKRSSADVGEGEVDYFMSDFEVAASADAPEDDHGAGRAGNRFRLDPVLFWSKLGQNRELPSDFAFSRRQRACVRRLQDTGKRKPTQSFHHSNWTPSPRERGPGKSQKVFITAISLQKI